ncbi:L-threonylcarbamoyladenylate synthase [Geitlerinema splendidum]|jgi:L-threonylcarbamoyladenylate synthase|nr:L-threonylcarbamoyladenylate synthase [Geitlerinema splendidum]
MIVSPTPEALEEALQILHAGDLIGLPTETVYGLAADGTQDLAVAKIFEQKNRPSLNPLIIHGATQTTFQEHVEWNERAQLLADAFWPGPLTLVLPRKLTSSISLLASAGLETLAIRIPHHPVALDLLKKFGKPLAAPSANRSGKVSPTTAEHVAEDFPNLFILNGGATTIGLESTILDLTSATPLILRPGGISQEELEVIIGQTQIYNSNTIKAPGMMKSHYAPHLPLRLNALEPQPGEAFLAFGPTLQSDLNLSTTGELREAAANLFKMLRLLDKIEFKGIAVAPIPMQGLGLALNDRLQRAAAPRDL